MKPFPPGQHKPLTLQILSPPAPAPLLICLPETTLKIRQDRFPTLAWEPRLPLISPAALSAVEHVLVAPAGEVRRVGESVQWLEGTPGEVRGRVWALLF